MRKDKTKIRSQENRRVDTLAKLLTGDSVCTALTFDKYNKQFLISTNTLSSDEASILNEYFKNDKKPPNVFNARATKLGMTLKLIADCAGNIHNVDQAKQKLYPHVYKYIIDRNNLNHNELISGIDGSVKIGEKELLNYLKLSQTKELFTEDCYKQFEQLLKIKENIISSIKWGPYKNVVTQFFDSLLRTQKDINKICQILYNENFKDFKEAIQNKAFLLVGPHNSDNTDKNAHAEMNLIAYLLENQFNGTWYFGINKLTCFSCTNDIIITNNTGKLTILTRGEHNVDYSERRIQPTFTSEDQDNLIYYRERFNTLSTSEKTKTLEQANFSDSEVEALGDIKIDE